MSPFIHIRDVLSGLCVTGVWVNVNAIHCPFLWPATKIPLDITSPPSRQYSSFKQPLPSVNENTMSCNNDNPGQGDTQRALLLRESRFHQEQADNFQVRLEELQGVIEGLEADYRVLQDSVVNLEIRNSQLMQEVSYCPPSKKAYL